MFTVINEVVVKEKHDKVLPSKPQDYDCSVVGQNRSHHPHPAAQVRSGQASWGPLLWV